MSLLRVVALLAVLGAPRILLAQGLEEVPPQTLGFTTEGLRAIDSVMARYTQRDRFPAAVLLVARRGKVAYWKAFGARDLAQPEALKRTATFRIFSLTKPITATAILMLWEEGKIDLDDPAEKYIPELSELKVMEADGTLRPPRTRLSIRHLLTFTSGLNYGIWGTGSPADSLALAAAIDVRAESLPDAMRRIAEVPLVGDPGRIASYGWQVDVLGRIVEVAGGLPLDKFLEARIFRPLGMGNTGFHVSATLVPDMPVLYSIGDGKAPMRAPDEEWTGAYGSPPIVTWGGHGLVSTPSDYIRFAQMIANRGELDGVRLLKASTVEMMTSQQVATDVPRLTTLLGPGFTFGMACFVATDLAAAGGGGHEGLYYFSGAANLFVWTDPRSELVGMVWAQALPYRVYPLFTDVRNVVSKAFVP
ncbi:MAG: beta-lactamase family protein [Gammaproteobacteria bacterium]|nr:beta-lactamase family protein [Gammaproteobacteria bacterium]